MGNSQNDAHLHLQRIGEDQRVVRSMPSWINTERIVRRGSDSFNDVSGVEVSRPFVVRRSKIERKREDVVVDQTGVHGKDSHQEDNVSTIVESVEDLFPRAMHPSDQQGRKKRNWYELNVPRFRFPA